MKRFELSQSSIIFAILTALISLTNRCDGRSLDWFGPFIDGRIVGGEETSLAEVPYQVSLQLRGKHYCGGSIIATNLMVTAAHCLQQSAVLFSVRSGSDYGDKGGTVHQIERILVHENYRTNRKTVPMNDIALVWTVEPFDVSKSAINRIVKMYEKGEDAVPGEMGIVSGWGATKLGPTTKLRAVQVPIISKKSCDEAYVQFGGLPEKQICAAYPEGQKDSCQGDSGGPFVVNGRLAGIVSWGKGCGEKGFPGVYTEVAEYREWIREKSGI